MAKVIFSKKETNISSGHLYYRCPQTCEIAYIEEYSLQHYPGDLQIA